MEELLSLITAGAVKLVVTLFIYVVGKAVISRLMKFIVNLKAFNAMDDTLKSFLTDAIRTVLYVLLAIMVIGNLGVPMSSVVAVLATAGLAVGMALQGSLSNLAGGVMLMLFKPFRVNDYITASVESGTVKSINLFYTVLQTVDNKLITVPNGSLMASNVTNYSGEETRRVDLSFACAKGEDIDAIKAKILETIGKNTKVLNDPAPFVRLSGGTEHSMEFTVRTWVNSADYWDVFFDLNEAITKALGELGVKAPTARVVVEEKK